VKFGACLLLALAATPALAVESPAKGVASFVVVVGTTRADRPGLATLRYSDDDAARWAELAGLFAEKVELLAALDDDTQQRHPGLADMARLPTRAELLLALARTRAAIDVEKANGRRTALWFVFAGHGDVSDNHEGYLVLQDGRFTRTDLYEEVLAKSNADLNHVVLDACRAWFMVSRRGPAATAAIRELLDRQSLERFPNTGVLLATTESAEVHEWDRFRAGVFSHEVRSALAGGADVDGDSRVTYLEVAAFVSAANAKVTDPRGKLAIAAIPPASNRAAALVDWTATRSRQARISTTPREDGPLHLEDERGVRLADLHLAAGQPVTLVLPPGRALTARGGAWEARIPATAAGETVTLDAVERAEPSITSRGTVADAFDRGLFAVPFGASFYEGFAAANPRGIFPPPPPLAPRGRSWRTPAAWSVVGSSLATAAVAANELQRSRTAQSRYRQAFGTQDDVAAQRERAESSREKAWIAGSLSAASGAASAWLFWSEHRRLSVVATADEGDLGVAVAWRFGAR